MTMVKVSDEEILKIREMNLQGFTDRQIAEILKFHRRTIGRYRQKMGLLPLGRIKRRIECLECGLKIEVRYYQQKFCSYRCHSRYNARLWRKKGKAAEYMRKWREKHQRQRKLCLWTEQEIDLLRKLYPGALKDQILKNINRSWGAIVQKAVALKIRTNRPFICHTKVLTDEMKRPSWDLGYIIGVLLGDGSLYCVGRKYVLELQTTSEIFASFFKQILEKWSKQHVIFYSKSISDTKFCYCVCYISKEVVQFLWEIIKDKNGLPQIVYSSTDCFWGTLSGYFDSDGCLSKSLNKGRWLYWHFSFGDSKRGLLESIRDALIENGFHPSRVYQGGGRCWLLSLNKQKEVFRLANLLGGFKIAQKWRCSP